MAIDEGNSMAAELLAVSANAYAACASSGFIEKRPEAAVQFGESAFGHWKDYFFQRILELSDAMAENEPILFSSRIRWSRSAFQARKIPEELLIESLNCLAAVLEKELPESFREMPKHYINEALGVIRTKDEKASELDGSDPSSKLAMQYLLHALEGNSRKAIKLVVDAHTNGLSLGETYGSLITAQSEIGRMWHEAEINVAEEHLVTSTTKRAMAVLTYQCEMQPPNGLTVVAAAVHGNAHDIGVQLVSDFFELAGWRAIYLGGDLPGIDIARAVEFFNGSLVLLSAALSSQLKAIRETVNVIRDLDRECKIMVGGTAFQEAPEICGKMGADAYAASPMEAISIGSGLIQN